MATRRMFKGAIMCKSYHWWEKSVRCAVIPVFCLIALIGMGISSRAQNADHQRPAKMLSPEAVVNSDGTIATDKGLNGTVDIRGWDVTLDSDRGPVITPQQSTQTWSALANNGLNSYVNALAVSGTDMYVGGDFSATFDSNLYSGYIAKYSGGVWSALANQGLHSFIDGNNVNALAVSGTDLYVGGYFQRTSDGSVTNLNNIAKYIGGVWSALPHNGLSNQVLALAVSGTDLYVGGDFTQTEDGGVTNLNYIARYSGGVWSALANNGLNSHVNTLAVSGTNLYIGGNFTQTADGSVMALHNIAKYSGGVWSALANYGLDGEVYALAVSGTDLYVGGNFIETDDANMLLFRIAKYSGGAWSALPNNGLNGDVKALAVSGMGLYAGGQFSKTLDGSVNLHNIARLNVCTGISITTHPQSQTIGIGSQATLSVVTTGDAPLHYQWYQGASGNTTTPVGADSSTYTTPALTAGAQYWVRMTNACGQETDSNTATITVQAGCVKPTITTEPQSQTISSGSTATLTIVATGDAPIHYQWYRGASGDSSTPVGTDSNTYTTAALTTTTSYWVNAYNTCGYDDSQTAIITVTGSGGLAITSVTSKKRTAGSPATIIGTGFSATAKNNKVKFGTLTAKVNKKAKATSLKVTIPRKCKKGTTYDVTVTVGGKMSNALPFTMK